MKKIFIYTALSVATLFATSCNNWLDVRPEAQVDANKLFSKEKGFEDALTACYIKMNSTSLYGRELTMQTVEYLAQHWTTQSTSHDLVALKDFQYDAQYVEGLMVGIYKNLYNTIVQANLVIENLDKSGDVIEDKALRDVIRGEALGIRAFCHTDVLRLFGQVPTKAATLKVQLPYAKTVGTEMIPYYAFEDYVELILQDIEDAQALLKESDPVMTYTMNELDKMGEGMESLNDFLGYRRFRMNYYALEALKARLYMYVGDKTNAYQSAQNVIGAKSKSGSPMFELSGNKDFINKHFSSPTECIFALSNSKLEDYVMNLFGSNGLHISKSDFTKLFPLELQGVDNRVAASAVEGEDEQKTTSGTFVKGRDSQGAELWTLNKYKQPEVADNEDDTDLATKFQVIPLIRLSEMYLIAAECAALPEGNKLYAAFMAAKGIVPDALSEDELRQELLNEYHREFYGEGQMFYTYKRLGTKKMLWKSDREVGEKDYIVPLPTSELGSN